MLVLDETRKKKLETKKKDKIKRERFVSSAIYIDFPYCLLILIQL